MLALLFQLLFQPGDLLHRRFLQLGDGDLQPLDLPKQLAYLKTKKIIQFKKWLMTDEAAKQKRQSNLVTGDISQTVKLYLFVEKYMHFIKCGSRT